MTHPTTNLDETASPPAHQIAQPTPSTSNPNSNIIYLYGGSPTQSLLPAKTRPLSPFAQLIAALKRANANFDKSHNLKAFQDTLFEAVFRLNTEQLRAFYGISESDNLHQTIKTRNPIAHLYLVLAEHACRLAIEKLVHEQGEVRMGRLLSEISRVADAYAGHREDVGRYMGKDLFTGGPPPVKRAPVVIDEYDEDEDDTPDDEDMPFSP